MSSVFVKSATEAIFEESVSRNLLLRSGTFAYALQLIRAGKFDLAEHVLFQFDTRTEAAYKDLLFYLRTQIFIAKENFTLAKNKLLARVEQNPQDITALSLLQVCISDELEHAKLHPELIAKTVLQPPATLDPKLKETTLEELQEYQPEEGLPTLPVKDSLSLGEIPMRYIPVLEDEKTRGFMLWGGLQGRRFSQIRDVSLGKMQKIIEESLPRGLEAACRGLEAGAIFKICFAFEQLTLTSFHGRDENVALITGPFQQSLLTLVRAENIYQQNQNEARLSTVS